MLSHVTRLPSSRDEISQANLRKRFAELWSSSNGKRDGTDVWNPGLAERERSVWGGERGGGYLCSFGCLLLGVGQSLPC